MSIRNETYNAIRRYKGLDRVEEAQSFLWQKYKYDKFSGRIRFRTRIEHMSESKAAKRVIDEMIDSCEAREMDRIKKERNKESLRLLAEAYKESFEGKSLDDISDSLYGLSRDGKELFSGDCRAIGFLAGGGPGAEIGFYDDGLCIVAAFHNGHVERVSFQMDFDIQDLFREGLL